MSQVAAVHEFVPVAKVADLSDPGRMVVEVEERLIVLIRVGGEFFALDDVCTHDDGPLSDGVLGERTIACPRHGAQFDVRTGAALTMPAVRATQAHDVEVRGDDVYVRLRHGSKSPSPAVAESSTTSNERTCEAPPIPPPAAVAEGATPAPVEISEEAVREALKQVVDPELFVNIVDLGLVYNVTLSDRDDGRKHVHMEMTMTSPACPAGPQLIQNSKDVLGRIADVGSVEVKLVMVPPWTPDRMTEAARDQLGIF